MRDPLWRLKTLPWVTLLQNAALSVLIATAGDLILVQLFLRLPAGIADGGLSALLGLLLLLLPFLAAVGLGALSVLLMEWLFRAVYLDTSTLWALVPCLALMLFLKGLVPALPTLMISFSYSQLVGVVLGIFFKGKRYWRY